MVDFSNFRNVLSVEGRFNPSKDFGTEIKVKRNFLFWKEMCGFVFFDFSVVGITTFIDVIGVNFILFESVDGEVVLF